MEIKDPWLRLAWMGVICCLICGCHRRDGAEQGDSSDLAELAALPGLSQTHHVALREELARLVAERATPRLLASSPNGMDHLDLAVKVTAQQAALEQIISKQQIVLVLQRVDKLYPRGPFRFGPVALENAVRVRDQFTVQLDKYRELVRRDDFGFHVLHTRGLLADLSFIDHARLLHRLEAISAAEALAEGYPTETMFPLRNMFLVDQRLAVLKHVVPRLAAARLRAEAFQVVRAIVDHPQCTIELQRELLRMVNAQLESWPPDADAWIGDRAQGMLTYELVRHGELLSVLTRPEIDRLKKQRELKAFIHAVSKSIDEDEWFYLDTMRKVVSSCRQPFFRRRKALDDVMRKLNGLRDTPRYPLFAATVLLPDLVAGHRLQAADRARCEGWSVALAAATGAPSPPHKINPLTGDAYQLERSEQQLQISGIDRSSAGGDIVVPLVTPAATGSRQAGESAGYR